MFSGIIAKISLSICIIVFSVLTIMIYYVLVDFDGSYNNFIQSQFISHDNLQYAIAVAGLILILLSAIISWFVSLYGSFRIAGPLYRFSQNIRAHHQSDKMLSLRSDDSLQDLSTQIIHASKQIEDHKNKILRQIIHCQKLIEDTENNQSKKQLVAAFHKLKQIESRASFD